MTSPTVYSVNCTGDVVVGDRIEFDRAVFGGSYRHPVFLENETVQALVLRESYGRQKQQHTFTLQRADGTTFRIKGRNIYRNGTKRQPWANESLRHEAESEKHARGDRARSARLARTSHDDRRDWMEVDR
jgi:hypothetical protein